MEQRRQAKMEYKQSLRPMGVWAIHNRENGKHFVLGTMNLPASMNRHRFDLRLGSHINKALQQDWNTYGAEAFDFTVLEEVKPREEPQPLKVYQDEVKLLMELWLEKLQPYGEQGYNNPAEKARII